MTTSKDADAPKGADRVLTIARNMSSPSVKIDDMVLLGTGLALVGVSVEQDAAYWEWHVELCRMDGSDHSIDKSGDDESSALSFGVATKKNSAYFRSLDKSEENMNDPKYNGTELMKSIVGLQDGDTVGIAVQQSDLPMIQFLVNGEPLHELAINRFRGVIYPSVFLRKGMKVTGAFHEDEFKEMSPHIRFGPLIAARGLI